jgi:preprotein translocase subunit Sec63
MVRAYTIRDLNYRRMTPDDVIERIINHEILLEEARYVKNLSKDIISTKASMKSKKKQVIVESSSEEKQEEDESEE